MRRLLASMALFGLATAATAAEPPPAPKAAAQAKAKAAAAKYPTLEIGAEAPDFRLPGVDGKDYALDDFKDARVLVVLFTCNHCPTAQAYEARFKALHAEYKDKGVAVVAISPNDPAAIRLDELGYTDLGDSFADMKARARDAGIEFPYLYDGETQEVSKAFGVLATPHVYIFDSGRKLRYVGRFDDAEVKEVRSRDAIHAVDALLAGRPVPVETTRVFGCSTKWSDKREEARAAQEKTDAEAATIAPIDLEGVAKLARNDTEKFRLVNLWATWCGPCVSEMPELVTMHRMYRKRPFELVTISLDGPDKADAARKALDEVHASTTNYILTTDDLDKLAEALDPDWPGPIPYTLLIAPGGEVIYRHVGSIDPMEVKKAIVGRLGRTR